MLSVSSPIIYIYLLQVAARIKGFSFATDILQIAAAADDDDDDNDASFLAAELRELAALRVLKPTEAAATLPHYNSSNYGTDSAAASALSEAFWRLLTDGLGLRPALSATRLSQLAPALCCSWQTHDWKKIVELGVVETLTNSHASNKASPPQTLGLTLAAASPEHGDDALLAVLLARAVEKVDSSPPLFSALALCLPRAKAPTWTTIDDDTKSILLKKIFHGMFPPPAAAAGTPIAPDVDAAADAPVVSSMGLLVGQWSGSGSIVGSEADDRSVNDPWECDFTEGRAKFSALSGRTVGEPLEGPMTTDFGGDKVPTILIDASVCPEPFCLALRFETPDRLIIVGHMVGLGIPSDWASWAAGLTAEAFEHDYSAQKNLCRWVLTRSGSTTAPPQTGSITAATRSSITRVQWLPVLRRVMQFVEPAAADAAAIAATRGSALPPQLLQSASGRPAGSFVVGLLAALAKPDGGLPSDNEIVDASPVAAPAAAAAAVPDEAVFVVSGCGNEDFNGAYGEDGEEGGVPRYRKLEDGKNQTLNRLDSGDWYMCTNHSGNTYFRKDEGDMLPLPPTSGWAAGDGGRDPPPTLTFGGAATPVPAAAEQTSTLTCSRCNAATLTKGANEGNPAYGSSGAAGCDDCQRSLPTRDAFSCRPCTADLCGECHARRLSARAGKTSTCAACSRTPCEAELAKLLLAVDLPAIPAWAPAVSAYAAATLPDVDDPESPTSPEDAALALEICGGHIPSASVGALARLPEHDGAGPAGRIVAAAGGQIWLLGAGGSTTVSKVAATAVELVPWPSTGNGLLTPAQIVGAVQAHQAALRGAGGGWHGAWLALLALRGCKAALDSAADPGTAAAIATGLVEGGVLPPLLAAAASAGVSGPMVEAVATLEGKAVELIGKVWELPREERLPTSSGKGSGDGGLASVEGTAQLTAQAGPDAELGAALDGNEELDRIHSGNALLYMQPVSDAMALDPAQEMLEAFEAATGKRPGQSTFRELIDHALAQGISPALVQNALQPAEPAARRAALVQLICEAGDSAVTPISPQPAAAGTAPAGPSITGAGDSRFNGLYVKRAQSGPGDRAVYTHESNSTLKIQWSSMSGCWMLDDENGAAPYCILDRNDSDFPYDGAWSVYQGGNLPAPTTGRPSGLQIPFDATFHSVGDPYTITAERLVDGSMEWSNGIVWKDGPADGALCGQWSQYLNGEIHTVVQIGSSEIRWLSGANEEHFPARISAPLDPAEQTSHLSPETAVVKVSGCSMASINGSYNFAAMRNGRACYTHDSGNGALYFDGSHWKLCQQGVGPDESGWNFSQDSSAEGREAMPPLGTWEQSRATNEASRDYTGLELSTSAGPSTMKKKEKNNGKNKDKNNAAGTGILPESKLDRGEWITLSTRGSKKKKQLDPMVAVPVLAKIEASTSEVAALDLALRCLGRCVAANLAVSMLAKLPSSTPPLFAGPAEVDDLLGFCQLGHRAGILGAGHYDKIVANICPDTTAPPATPSDEPEPESAALTSPPPPPSDVDYLLNSILASANEAVVEYAATMGEMSSEVWCWDRRDETQMSLEEDGRRVVKRDGRGPDYSGCVGDTIFERGEHTWDLKVVH
jgi:hypothetical protein